MNASIVAIAACAPESGIRGYPDDCDPALEITEIAAANEAANFIDLDEPTFCDGASGWCCLHPDWLELKNTDDERTISLEGYTISVTGDAPLQPFSDAQLGPGERVIVVAAPSTPRPGADQACDDLVASLFPGYGFAGTDMDRDGGTGVRLVGPGGGVCQGLDYQDQHADLSDSSQGDGVWCITFPTPGAPNGPCLDEGTP